MACLLFASALLCSCLVATSSLVLTSVLVLLVIGYNAASKSRAFLGPMNMAACRSANLLLGMSPSLSLSLLPPALAGISFVYVFGITALSRHEMGGGSLSMSRMPLLGWGLSIAAVAALLLARVLTWEGLLFFIPFLVITGFALVRALIGRTGRQIGTAVGLMVLCIPLLDAVYASGAQGWVVGLAVSACAFPAVILSAGFTSRDVSRIPAVHPTRRASHMSQKRVIVIDVVGLRPSHLERKEGIPHISRLLDTGQFRPLTPVFPAVTLPVQASLTTGVFPEQHGVVSNGFYFPENFQVAFWEQSSALVQAERVWTRLRRQAPWLRTATVFFQNTLYADCEAVITPRPIHTEKGLVQWCYSKPVGLYEAICESIGPFNLAHYWGPFASIELTRWIAKAAVEVLDRVRPHLMFVYLPHLDYASQKVGPGGPGMDEELSRVDEEVGRIVQGVRDLEMERDTFILVLSEYVFSKVVAHTPINRLLRQEGLLSVRNIQGREYLDPELSPAFAMVDHQVAHVYVKPGRRKEVMDCLERMDGIALLLVDDAKRTHRVHHPRAGDIIAVSARDRWFSYYWWEDRSREPDFAAHIDIHRKPGYDPLEMFFEPNTFEISQDTSLIHGSHGYPPVAEEDAAVFLLNGDLHGSNVLPDDLCVPQVTGIIEALLMGDGFFNVRDGNP